MKTQDYQQLVSLLTNISKGDKDARYYILDTLQVWYENYPIAFFLTNENEQFIDPLSINISHQVMEEYNKHYYQIDIFHSHNIERKLLKKDIIHITDIMTIHSFERTEFYQHVLSRIGVYDEIALPLHYDNQLLGIIGIMKPATYGAFTGEEINYAKTVRSSILPSFSTHLQLQKQRNENKLLLNCIDQAPIGTMIFDDKQQIIYHNELVSMYIDDIFAMPNTNLNKAMLEDLLSRLNYGSYYYSSCLHSSLHNYDIKIVPFAVPRLTHSFGTLFALYIQKKQPIKNLNYRQLSLNYGLTNREYEIILLMKQGLSNKDIATQLFLSTHTIKTHIQNIFRKVDCYSRTEMIHKLEE